MKKIAFVLYIACFLTGSASAAAQQVSTQGRDFWVSFLPNWPDSDPKLEILVAGNTPCSGVATNPLTGWSASFSVTPGAVTSVVIPNPQGLMEKENTVEHKAIHVTTTADVSLYASNFYTATYDVSNVLPTNILADNYLAQAYSAGTTAASRLSSKMLIVGVENGTEITIDPKGGLKGSFPFSAKKRITLNAGECYLCISATGDITGTAVNVNNGKKVAVFSGGDTQIPYDGCCYDAVFEQCIPLSHWGRHFVVTASKERKNDIVRIQSLAPGCRISIDGKYRKTLGARQHFDYRLNGEKREAVYISASSPVSVCLFFTSATMGGIMGDPSMVNINPIEQQMDKVTFATYNTAVSKYHYVNVVTQTDQVKDITLDGTSIASEFKPVPHKRGLSFARIDVVHGSHTLESSSEGGFVAHIYGLGSYESYAYSAGSNSRVLNRFDEDGNLIFSSIPDEPEDEEDAADLSEDTPTYDRTDTLYTVEFGDLSIEDLKQGKRVLGRLTDPDATTLDPGDYDVTVRTTYGIFFEGIDAEIQEDSLIIQFHPRKPWCDCFIPQRIKVDVILVPVSAENGDSRIIIPAVIPIKQERPRFQRCLPLFLLTGALILLFLYLTRLLRKRRFKKSAMVIPVYFNHSGQKIELTGYKLRKEGFGAWFARWFWPGDEKTTIDCSMPAANIRFLAAASEHTVILPKDGNIDANTIQINGYNPKNDPVPKEPFILGDNGRINISNQLGVQTGYLIFSAGDDRDGGVYRLLLSLLAIASAILVLTLIILILIGLF